MNLKEAIKAVVKSGITIDFPYKSKINEWYSEFKFHKSNDYYRVGYTNFHDLDEAVNFFLDEAFTSKNVGYIQSRLVKKGLIDIDNEDILENPNKKIKSLFKEEGKLVDEEAKAFNIIVKPFPLKEDAINAFENLVKEINVNNFKELLTNFEQKYSVLGLFIFVSFRYKYDDETKTDDYAYSYTFDYEDFSIEKMEEFKSLYIKDLHWHCVNLSLSIADSKFQDYNLFF